MAVAISTQQRRLLFGGIKYRCKRFFGSCKRFICLSGVHSAKPSDQSDQNRRTKHHNHYSKNLSSISSENSYSPSSNNESTDKQAMEVSSKMLPHVDNDDQEVIVKGESNFEIPHVDLLTWLFGNDAYNHDKTILVDALNDQKTITTNQAKSIIKSLIGGLKSIGVKPGDAVCIHSYNDIYYPLMFLAIVGVGGRFVGTNPGQTVRELNNHLTISETKFLVVQPGLFPNILKAAENLGIPEKNIISFDTDGQDCGEYKFRSINELLQHDEEEWISFDDEKTAKETIMGMFSSSGTTGMPKVIALSHYAWVSGSVILPEVLKRPYEVRRLMFLPAFHGFAAPLYVATPIRIGQTTFVMPRFDLKQFCKAVEDHSITDTAVVPPVLKVLAKSSLENPDQLKSLKRVWCGAAPLNIKLQNEVIKLFAQDAEIVNIWGMTEIGITVGLKYEEADRTGAASKLLANTEAKIVNDSGVNITSTGQPGEIQIRSPQAALGYYHNEKATRETFLSDGWVHTGDIAYFKDGKLYIIDRKKELIKVRGWQVAPAELEDTLFSHPEIEDAAVIGITIKSGEEEYEAPRAYVVRPAGGTITEDQVKEFISTELSSYKALTGGVVFVDAIPKSAAGKILKKIMRTEEWLAQNSKE